MFIGSLGSVTFRVSRNQIRTFKNLARKRTAKSAKHDVLEGLPRLQHTGRDLDELTLTVVLERMSNYDATPDTAITALLQMIDSGDEVPLMFGLRYHGLWFVQDVAPSHTIIQRGVTWRAEVAVTLVEYDLTPAPDAYSQAASAALGSLAGDTVLTALDSVTGLAAELDGLVADVLGDLTGLIAEGASSLTAFVTDGVMSLNNLVADGLMDLNSLVPAGILDLAHYIPDGITDINAFVSGGLLDLNDLVTQGALDLSTLASSGVLSLTDLASQGALNVGALVSEGVSDLTGLAASGALNIADLASQGARNVGALISEGVSDLTDALGITVTV